MASNSSDWNLSNEKGRGTSLVPSPSRNLQAHEIISENIQKFFKYNAQNLVRPAVAVDGSEQSKARTWVFFLILVQIIVCVAYGFFLTYISRKIIHFILAITLIFYYVVKLIFVLSYNLKRLFTCQCKSSDYDPESADYEEVFICVPVYNESRSVLEQTVSAITNSNYTKHKLYVVFIVDGNKGSTFQALMEVLEGTIYEERVPSATRVIKHGACNGVNYSVFLKDQNRGKRDSQWLFIELVRNIFPEHKPPYLIFLDSDTTFEPNAIRYMVETLKSDERVAGVCGQVRIGNFKRRGATASYSQSSIGAHSVDSSSSAWDKFVFRASTLVILGAQYYEYSWNTLFNKHAEASVSAVTQLESHFSMYRTDIVVNIDAQVDVSMGRMNSNGSSDISMSSSPSSDRRGATATQFNNGRSNMSFYYVSTVKDTLPLVTQDFFSKPTVGLVDRNLYYLGSDKILTSKCLQLGYKTVYDPRVISHTQAPDSVANLMHQRRRWNNTNFMSQAVNFVQWRLWLNPRTFVGQVLSLFDLIGSYLLLTHSILIIYAIWTPFIRYVTSFSPSLIIFMWVLVQIIIVSSTRLDTSDMFYVLNSFSTGIMMGVSIYFFVNDHYSSIIDNVVSDPSTNWAITVVFFIFPVLHIIVSIFSPLSFIAAIGQFLMFPSLYVTTTIYSFFHLDDFSWSSR